MLRTEAHRTFFIAAERLLPMRDDCWCFCTWATHNHTIDNPRAVFEEVKNDPSIRKVIIRKQSQGPPPEGGSNVIFADAESFRGAYWVARSRVLLLGYALRGMASYARHTTSRHVVVQLWHGTPLRRIGLLYPHEKWWGLETPLYSAVVASSSRERKNLAKAFSPVPQDRIWVTGLPRNSFIVGDEEALPRDYRDRLDGVRRMMDGRRLVLYAPTWRDREDDHYHFSSAEYERLTRLLRKHRAVLGIRGHPNVQRFYASQGEGEHVIRLDHIPDVNLLLRETAVLITDYSSIAFDFLLTDRPILYFLYDHDAYREKRVGFLYELDEALAGPISRTFDELEGQLDRALSWGVGDTIRYARVRALFHEHGPDAASAVTARIRTLLSGP